MSDIEDIAGDLIRLAHMRSLRLATAESCTAGCLAKVLADAPGAGAQFHGGFIVYSKEQKISVLGVSPDVLSSRSAVCEEVAKGMAEGVLAACPADVAIAITGVAGPEPDEDGNPVGLMHVAVAHRSGHTLHRQLDLGVDRRRTLRIRAIRHALTLAREVIEREAT